MFAPFAMVAFCEDAAPATKGFDFTNPKLPFTVNLHDGSAVMCTADGCTAHAGVMQWERTPYGCMVKKNGKSGKKYDDFEEDAECAKQQVLFAQLGAADSDGNPVFGMMMYTVAKPMMVTASPTTRAPRSPRCASSSARMRLSARTRSRCGMARVAQQPAPPPHPPAGP